MTSPLKKQAYSCYFYPDTDNVYTSELQKRVYVVRILGIELLSRKRVVGQYTRTEEFRSPHQKVYL